MSNIFNGMSVAQQIYQMRDDRQDRKTAETRERNIAAAGQVASQGDTKGASEMLLSAGQVAEAREYEDRDYTRYERGEAKVDRQFQLDERQREKKERNHERKVATELYSNPLTEESLQAAAGQIASVDPAQAGQFASASYEMGKVEKAGMANQVMSGYVAGNREQRTQFVKSVLDNPDYANDIDDTTREMLENDDPSDDDMAVAQWVQKHGGDATPLLDQIEKDRAARRSRDIKLAVESAKKSGTANTILADGLGDQPSGVITSFLDRQFDMEESAAEDLSSRREQANVAREFVDFLNQHPDIKENMGGGTLGDLGRQFAGMGDARYRELGGITQRLVTLTKKPGSGVFTDDDARRAEESVMSAQMTPEGVDRLLRIATGMEAYSQSHSDYLDRMSIEHGQGWVSNGSHRAVWQRYRAQNPLFDASGSINQAVQPFDLWYEESYLAQSMSDDDIMAGLEGLE